MSSSNEKADLLFKASLGFPSTNKEFEFFQESASANNYLLGEEVLVDAIPGTPSFSGGASITYTLSDSSTFTATRDTTNVVDSAITNSKVESSTSSTTGLDGATKIRDGSIPAVKLAAANIDRSLNISGNNLGINNSVTPTTGAVKVNFNAQGLVTGSASLSSSDLSTVIATSTAIGAVKVPSAGGLSVNGTGEISISATTTGAI